MGSWVLLLLFLVYLSLVTCVARGFSMDAGLFFDLYFWGCLYRPGGLVSDILSRLRDIRRCLDVLGFKGISVPYRLKGR